MEDDPLWDLERQFSWCQDDDGSYVFKGRLPADEGETVATALQNICDLIWRENRQQQTEECGSQTENVSAESLPANHFEGSMASAVVRMAEHCLATGIKSDQLDLKTPAGPDRTQLLIFVNVNDANKDCLIEDGPALNTASGKFMHPEVVRQLACDAVYRPIGEDDDGNVLSIGRKSRVIPPHIRLAVERRDRGCCRYPGCTQRKRTDLHHIIHWANGGETSAPNLITLCRFHHGELHRGRYRIKTLYDDFVFLTANGVQMARVVPFDTRDPDTAQREVEARLTADGIEITPQTAVTRWEGERMNMAMALEALFAKDVGNNVGKTARGTATSLPTLMIRKRIWSVPAPTSMPAILPPHSRKGISRIAPGSLTVPAQQLAIPHQIANNVDHIDHE